MNKLPWHWPIVKQVIRKHLDIILLMFCMGLIFSCMGGLAIWFAKDVSMIIFGATFLLAGLGLIIFGAYANFSSCVYYYEQALLKQYGNSVIATVSHKNRQDSLDSNRTANPDDDVIDTDLFVQYTFTQLGKTYEGESIINELALFDAIEIGMKVPVIVMQGHPNITRLQSKKLKNQLNLANKINTQSQLDAPNVSQPLMEDDI